MTWPCGWLTGELTLTTAFHLVFISILKNFALKRILDIEISSCCLMKYWWKNTSPCKILLSKRQTPRSAGWIAKYIGLINYFENGRRFHVNRFLFHGQGYGTYLLQATRINMAFIFNCSIKLCRVFVKRKNIWFNYSELWLHMGQE